MPLPTENSRLLNVPVVKTVDNREIYEIRTPLPYTPVSGMRPHRIEGDEKLWDIAGDEYGDPLLYWAIADFNDIHDVTTEVFAGLDILIPPKSYIDEFLSSVIQ